MGQRAPPLNARSNQKTMGTIRNLVQKYYAEPIFRALRRILNASGVLCTFLGGGSIVVDWEILIYTHLSLHIAKKNLIDFFFTNNFQVQSAKNLKGHNSKTTARRKNKTAIEITRKFPKISLKSAL